MILARVAAEREPALRAVLASMNGEPGTADPQNALVPFGHFDRLHFARFVLLDDATTDDLRLYGLTPPAYPRYLAFLGDVDGDVASFTADLATRAAAGLDGDILALRGVLQSTDLGAWMCANAQRPRRTTSTPSVARYARRTRTRRSTTRSRATPTDSRGSPMQRRSRCIGSCARSRWAKWLRAGWR